MSLKMEERGVGLHPKDHKGINTAFDRRENMRSCTFNPKPDVFLNVAKGFCCVNLIKELKLKQPGSSM